MFLFVLQKLDESSVKLVLLKFAFGTSYSTPSQSCMMSLDRLSLQRPKIEFTVVETMFVRAVARM